MNGMTEIKPGIKIRIKNIFLMHPVAVAVVLVLVVLVMFGGCSTAKAEGLDSEYVEWFDSNLADRFSAQQLAVIHSVMEVCPYYIWLYDETTDYWLFIFTKYAYTEDSASTSIEPWLSTGQYNVQLGYNPAPKCAYTPYTLGNLSLTTANKTNFGYYYFDTNGYGVFCQLGGVNYSDRSWNRFWYNCSANSLSGFSNSNVSYTFDWLSYGVHSLEDNNHVFSNAGFARLLLGEYTARSDWYCNPYPEPDYVEDSRLKLSVLSDSYGDDFLRIDFTRFMVGDNNYTSNSFHDVVVEMNADDNNITVDIDDISTINDTQPNVRYIRDVLLSDLGLDDYENVTITAVTFVQSVTVLQLTQDYQYSILCDFRLKGASYIPSMLDLEYDDDTSVGKISQVVIDEITDQVNFQEGYYSPMGGGGQQLVVPDGFNVKYVMIYGSKPLSSVIQSFIDGNFISGLTSLNDYIVDAVFGITSSDDAKAFIDESVRDNHYTQSYDIVVYYWCPDSSLGEVDVMYYYLTACGRLRQANQLLADIYVEANQTAYNTYAIYDYLYNRLNDFEDKTLVTLGLIKSDTAEEISWLQSLNSSVLGLEDVVSSGVRSIISAIPNAFDDSSILDVLADILDAIGNISSDNEDDTVAEAISYYLANNDNGYPTSQVFAEHKMSLWFSGKVHNYLEGSSIDDTRQLTLMYAFDAFRGAWDTIRSDSSYFGAIGEYLQSFSGEPMNDANGNIYYIQHIWTDSFDPNSYDGFKEE